MKKISTSISTFRNIIEAGYIYVDKTKYIYEMVRQPFGQFFFSRPRRFGKSLTVSTLEAVFSDQKELFKDCFIYNADYDWKEYPIIHIDFGRIDSSTVSVFSKLNNLVDISRSLDYSDAVGYNAFELERYFGDYIKEGAKKLDCSVADLMAKLAEWYDGFKFAYEGRKVYNPVSVGRFFTDNYEFSNYWYATVTPVLLINFAKKQKITPESIENAIATDLSFSSFDIMSLSENNVDPETITQLLLQTGYLTIGEREEKSSIPYYKLKYPNKEVQMSFETDLASIYIGRSKNK